MNNNFEEVIARLEELREEFDSNKKLKEKMNSVISILRKNPDLVIEKALTKRRQKK